MTRPNGSNSTQAMRRRGDRSAWLAMLIIVPVGLALLPSALLLLVGLVPTMVAVMIDRDPDKYASITVGSLNLSGTMPALIHLWQNGHTVSRALDLALQPFAILPMYAAAALGWLIYFATPPVATWIVGMRAEAEINRLKRRQEELIAEWGEVVAAAELVQEQG